MGDGEEKDMEVDEFVMRFTDLIGSKQGSSLQKMSSILSTCGKQIDMVYPKTNVNFKYFAMSEGGGRVLCASLFSPQEFEI